MRKGEATRVRIVEEAARQAALRGLTGVSLADVSDAIGLSKSGLFKHFDSKEAMHLAVVDAVLERFTESTWRSAEPLPPGRARLEAIFDRWLAWCDEDWPESGCPIMAFTVELDDQPGPLRDLLQRGLKNWRKTLLREFRALREPPLSDAEAQGAYFQMKSYILGHAEARRMMDDADSRGAAKAAFEALLERLSQPAR